VHDSPAPSSPHASARISKRRLYAGGLALLVAGGLIGTGVTKALDAKAAVPYTAVATTGGRLAGPAASAVPKGFAPPVPAPAAPASHVSPVEVAAPAISVRSKLINLHLNPDKSLQVPVDYGVAGWYSDGPSPGETGPPAVIIGHVDSKAGPGIFYRLAQMHKGDTVLTRGSDGSALKFVVYDSQEFPKDAFPADKVYAPTTTPELRLITCTGTFNKTSGHYLNNRVVYARLAQTA